MPLKSRELDPKSPWMGVLLREDVAMMLPFRSSGFSRNTKFKSYCVLIA